MAISVGAIPQIRAVLPNLPTQRNASALNPLIAALWGANNGHHFIATQDPKTSAFETIPVLNAEAAVCRATEEAGKGRNVFLACSSYSSTDRRTADNVANVGGFWLDIDCGSAKSESGKGYSTQDEAKAALQEFCSQADLPSPTYLINSGYGLHTYWILDRSIGVELWRDIAKQFKELIKNLGLKADPARTADPASLMRFPGSMNLKGDRPLPVEYIDISPEPIQVRKMLDAISVAHENLCGIGGNPKQVHRQEGEVLSRFFSQAEFDRLRSALSALDPDCDEYTWKIHRMAVLANLAKRHPEWAANLCTLAQEWSSGNLTGKPSRAWTTPGSTNGKTGEEVFDATWQRFISTDYSGPQVTERTIYYHAKEVGWLYPDCSHQRTSSAVEVIKGAYTQSNSVLEGQTTEEGRLTPLAAIQGTYCLVTMDSRFWVFDRHSLSARNANGLASKPEFFNQKEGKLLVNRALRVQGITEDDAGRDSRKFFTCPKTVCYDGIEFNPKGQSANRLNLWVGPTLVPKEGSWALIRSFLFEIICDNDQAAYEYLIRYLAHSLQFPEDKPGIMVVLMGGQGIGKGTLGKILRLIWSATYWHIHKIEDVTGNFNASLERAFIIFMDEALFVGDRKSSDALKALVTESVIQINEKYQPARQTKSYHRFFAATNSEHFKNTEHDDRRDFVLNVSEAKKGEHGYWSDLNAEIEAGGVAAMMHDLMAMELSNFNVRAKPITAALIDQKIRSLGPTGRWWHGVLVSGDMGTSESIEWLDFIATKSLVEQVAELQGWKIHRKPSDVDIVATMKKLCPSVSKGQKQTNLGRQRGLFLPNLQIARREFEQYIGGPVPWDSV
jgi:hypothetical protein